MKALTVREKSLYTDHTQHHSPRRVCPRASDTPAPPWTLTPSDKAHVLLLALPLSTALAEAREEQANRQVLEPPCLAEHLLYGSFFFFFQSSVHNVSNKAFWIIASQFKGSDVAKSDCPVPATPPKLAQAQEVRSALGRDACPPQSTLTASCPSAVLSPRLSGRPSPPPVVQTRNPCTT